MSSEIKPNETNAEYALRVLTESLAYFTPTAALVRDGSAPKPANRPNLPRAA